LILVLVKCSLGPRVASIKAVNEAGNKRAGLAKLLSELSESNSKLYYVFFLSSIYSLSNELGGEKSSNWLSNKSGKLNRPPKVAIIIIKLKVKSNKVCLIN
jgi:hypothetical protein